MSVSSSVSTGNDIENSHSTVQEDASLQVPPFVPYQRVFANEQDGSLYEAVVRKASWTGKHWTFLVHYLGWNSRWDKWLPETEIFPDTEEVRSKQAKQQSKRKRREEDSSALRKKRTEKGPTYEEYCELPFTLQTILADDRERIMRLGLDAPRGLDCDVKNWRPARDVHQLPAKVTIRTVLDHFVKYKKKEHAGDEIKMQNAETKARAFVEDLATLFDEALPVCLLYHPERAQHLATQADPNLSGMRKSDLYGCEFLLRFFIRLPVLLEAANMGNRKELGSQLADLIVLLQKNRQVCFKARYREPRDEELNDWEMALRDGAASVSMDE